MATKNDVTGDTISSKPTNDAFRKGWDRVFGNERQEVFVESTEDGSIFIFGGGKMLVKLSKEQYLILAKQIISGLTEEQVCQAIEECRRNA